MIPHGRVDIDRVGATPRVGVGLGRAGTVANKNVWTAPAAVFDGGIGVYPATKVCCRL